MIVKFSVHRRSGDPAPGHLRRHLDDLRSWPEYYLELASAPDDGVIAALCSAFGDPLLDTVSVDEPIDRDVVQVTYRRGIVDNENDSIVGIARLLGADAVAAKVARAYSSASPELAAVVGEQACNPNIEVLLTEEPTYDTLAPTGTYTRAETHDLRGADDATLVELGLAGGRQLDLDQMRHIQRIQERAGLDAVSDVLLEALDARWSDHCAHTTWTSLGKLLRRLIDAAKATENPNIVSMFHDNAGVWDFYDGQAIAVKAETHNGPSAVSAHFGQLTKIGGVLRDILGTGTGADPIGVFEYTATGVPGTPAPIEGRPDPRRIAQETIRAVKEYGNTFGVPMMWSHMTFHPDYRAKPFALGGSIGLIPVDAAQRGEPRRGDLLVLIGGLTGNDGIHGASGSSAAALAMDATSVQIGAPLEEIVFREAIVDLRDRGLLRAVTDLGAAGLNSAVGEMGDPVGVWLNTATVPLKTGGLPMWRILLSESQERMLLAIAPESLDAARAVLDRHQVRTSVVGTFTGDGRYCVVHAPAIDEAEIVAAGAAANGDGEPRPAGPVDEVGFDLPYDLLEWSPNPRDVTEPPPVPEPRHDWGAVTDGIDPVALAAAVLADPEVADQSVAALQYDSSVQGRTTYGPLHGPGLGVDTGVYLGRPILSSRAGVVFSTGFNPWACAIDPVGAARQAVFTALAAQGLVGVARRDVCLCDNFYTPHLTPDADAWLVAMVEELAELSRRTGSPFISGKDSSAGSTHTDEGIVSVPPGVFVSALGKVPDVDVTRREALCEVGSAVVLIGPRTGAIGGTVAARVRGVADVGGIDRLDVADAVAYLDGLAALAPGAGGAAATGVPSGRIIGAGGLLATGVRMARSGGLGIDFEAGVDVFAEHRCGALIEVRADVVDALPASLHAEVVGRVTAAPGEVRVGGELRTTPEVVAGWERGFREAIA